MMLTDREDFKSKHNDPYVYRFTQPDSIIPDVVNPQTWNRYSYVENRPIIFNDPTGHESPCKGDLKYVDPECNSVSNKEMRAPVRRTENSTYLQPILNSSALTPTPTPPGFSPPQIVPISTQTPPCPVQVVGEVCTVPRQVSTYELFGELPTEVSDTLDFLGFLESLTSESGILKTPYIFGLGIDATRQMLSDLDVDLSDNQRITRAVVEAGEGALTVAVAGSAAASTIMVFGGPVNLAGDAAAVVVFTITYIAMEKNWDQINDEVLFPWINNKIH